MAGFFSLLLAVVSLLRRKPIARRRGASSRGWRRSALDSIFTGLSLRATQLGEVVDWLTAAFIVKSFVPVIWLCFSLTYSRTNYREFLTRWKIPLAFVGLLPIGLSLGFRDQLFQTSQGTPRTSGGCSLV